MMYGGFPNQPDNEGCFAYDQTNQHPSHKPAMGQPDAYHQGCENHINFDEDEDRIMEPTEVVEKN